MDNPLVEAAQQILAARTALQSAVDTLANATHPVLRTATMADGLARLLPALDDAGQQILAALQEQS